MGVHRQGEGAESMQVKVKMRGDGQGVGLQVEVGEDVHIGKGRVKALSGWWLLMQGRKIIFK